MGFFKRKPKTCPKGSVHAYKDNKGHLHETEDGAKRANEAQRRREAKHRLEHLLTVGVYEEASVIDPFDVICEFSEPVAYRVQQRHNHLMRCKMSPSDVAEMLVNNWAHIARCVEEIKRDEDQEEGH